MKMTPLIMCKLPSINMPASWFLVSTYLISVLVSKINPIKQPIGRNSVGYGNVSHRRTYDHFVHGLTVFKNVQMSFDLRRCCACDNVIHIRQLINFSVTVSVKFWYWGWCFGFHCMLDFSTLDHKTFIFNNDLSLLDGCSLKNAILLSPHPIDREQGFHPLL